MCAGELADHDSLLRATENIDIIVSTVEGGREVLVDGQIALATAGLQNGVRRMVPSDFSYDVFQAERGEHSAFDIRAEADREIAVLGLQQINVMTGSAMEDFGSSGPFLDVTGGTFSFWGDGTQPVDCTSLHDTASVVASVALDRSLAAGKLGFAGDRLSPLDMGEIMSEHLGRELVPISLGTEADLRNALADAQRSDPKQVVQLGHALFNLTGQAKLPELQNERYPGTNFENFQQFSQKSLLAVVDQL